MKITIYKIALHSLFIIPKSTATSSELLHIIKEQYYPPWNYNANGENIILETQSNLFIESTMKVAKND